MAILKGKLTGVGLKRPPFSGGDKTQPQYKWWNAIGADHKEKLIDIIIKHTENETGLSENNWSTEYFNTMITMLHEQANAGFSFEQIDENSKMRIKKTKEGKVFRKGFNQFKRSLKAQYGELGSTKYMLSEANEQKLFDSYKDEYNAFATSSEPGIVDIDLETVLLNVQGTFELEFKEGVEDGTIDEETGEPIDAGEAGAVSSDEQFIRDFMKDNNFELSDAGVEHFTKLLRTKKADRFQIETMLRGTKEFTDAEFERLYNEFEPQIAEDEKRELGLLEDEAERTRKTTGEEFKRIAPALGRVAKQLGGRTREDTFITDVLAKERADIERTRGDFLEQQRLNVRFGQEQRRQLLKSGKFEELKAGAADTQLEGIKQATRIIQEQTRMQDKLSTLSSNKSLLLAQRAQQRHERDIQKQQDRLRRDYDESVARANKKARKLSGIVNPIIGAIGAGAGAFTAGGSVLLAGAIGGGISYAQNRLTNLDVKTPQLGFQDFTNIGSAIGPRNKQQKYIRLSDGTYVPD